MENLNQTNWTNVPKSSKTFNKVKVLTTALFMTLWLWAYSSNSNTIQNKSKPTIETNINFWYIDSLKSLNNDITSKEFQTEREKIEETIPETPSDWELQELFYWLYDLKAKFKNEKINKVINRLMEIYDPLFEKYDWFDDVRDWLSAILEDQNDITEEEFNRIENFFDGQWEIKMLYNSSKNEKYVNWWQLIIEELIDDDWTESKLQKAILDWTNQLLKEWKIIEKQLNDFKSVMATRGIMSSDLDKLQAN